MKQIGGAGLSLWPVELPETGEFNGDEFMFIVKPKYRRPMPFEDEVIEVVHQETSRIFRFRILRILLGQPKANGPKRRIVCSREGET